MCLKLARRSITAKHEASQRNSPTVPRRHNKYCINHCVSPGRQRCIMNDWCPALLLHILMHTQGSFSWNNSFDDPKAGGREVSTRTLQLGYFCMKYWSPLMDHYHVEQDGLPARRETIWGLATERKKTKDAERWREFNGRSDRRKATTLSESKRTGDLRRC